MASQHQQGNKRPLNEEFFSQEEQGTFRVADAFQLLPSRSSSWLQPRRPRPFPSSSVLTAAPRDNNDEAAAANTKPAACPLIQEFLRALGKSHLVNDVNSSSIRRGGRGLDDDGGDGDHGITGTNPVNGQQQQDNGQHVFPLANGSTFVSKITAGQHRRFLQLSSDHDGSTTTASRTPQTNKDYRRLKSLVKAEQQLYGQALHQFWLSNADRLQVGFFGGPSSCSFVQLAMKDVSVETWLHRKLPPIYGRCRQVISLRPTSKSSHTGSSNSTDAASSRKQQQRNTILDALKTEIVYQQPIDDKSTTQQQRKWVKTLPPHGSVIGNATSTTATTNNELADARTNVVPIQSDEQALELAKKHGAAMVTTAETLLVLLRTCISSKPPATSWIVPVSRNHQKDVDYSNRTINSSSRNNNSDLIILESPTQLSYSSTREWMTAGIEEGLNQWLEQSSSSTTTAGSKGKGKIDADSNISSSSPCYTYTLLTLPSPARNKPCRVLVRQQDRFFCASGNCPLRTHVHLEYFFDRGQREIPSILDKAVWMLDYVLQPLCRVVVAKVDPCNCRILEWNDVSLAHALTLPSSLPKSLLPMFDDDVNSSMDHLWQQLDHLLTMAIPTIGPGQHVLCYPARFGTTMTHDPSRQPRHHSMSVHQPPHSFGGGRNEEVLVDLSVEIPQARAMNAEQLKRLVEPDAIRRCYRPWQWQTTAENVESQIPYTFPVATVVKSKPKDP
jgi:hypothetical protein